MEREMKKIGGEGFPVSVDWNDISELKGVIAEQKAITYDGKERRCLTLETEEGELFTIWESRGLFPLFQVNEGVYVEIKNLGMKEMKSGYKMRMFDIFADKGQLEIPF
jgi:hypothetical protein